MKLSVLLVVVALAACGTDVDLVEGPFIDSWVLWDGELTLTVADHPGTAEASCVIYPLGHDGLETYLDAVDDLRPGDAYQEVFLSGPFTITGGEVVTFDVDLPEVDDPDFWRWQAVCDPGPPG